MKNANELTVEMRLFRIYQNFDRRESSSTRKGRGKSSVP